MSERFELIVVGSGVAGLATALAAAPRRVALLTLGGFGVDGASRWAQGGIAAAIGPDDAPALHAQDTLAAGQFHNDRSAVTRLTQAAPGCVVWLESLGARFDRAPSGTAATAGVSLGREAAHSRARIVHAGGDASGAEIMRALRQAVAAAAHITVFEHTRVDALTVAQGRVVGVQARSHDDDLLLRAPAVVLATGGIGALYTYSTNPATLDGSGLALALRAGAVLTDMEFVQFHPTALAPSPGQHGQLALLTEALRGAGATLLDRSGQRFMPAYAAAAELAPRDLVARAVWHELERHGAVFLDARKAVGAAFPQRFPTVFAACQARGIDPRSEPIPVVPAAHYLMGGIRVDSAAQSTLPGLYAVGECACSGVHGANRLASNSLLEGLVFGRALGQRLAAADLPSPSPQATPTTSHDRADIAPALAASIADLLWRHAGLVRDEAGLHAAKAQLQRWQRDAVARSVAADRIAVALSIVEAARQRRRSLGAHYRCDDRGAAAAASA